MLEDQQRQRPNYITLTSRILVDYFEVLAPLKDVCIQHIPHKYTQEMSQKSKKGVCLIIDLDLDLDLDTKARETKLNCVNTFGHSKTTTNRLPSSGESLSSADLITTLATNVIYVFLRNS